MRRSGAALAVLRLDARYLRKVKERCGAGAPLTARADSAAARSWRVCSRIRIGSHRGSTSPTWATSRFPTSGAVRVREALIPTAGVPKTPYVQSWHRGPQTAGVPGGTGPVAATSASSTTGMGCCA